MINKVIHVNSGFEFRVNEFISKGSLIVKNNLSPLTRLDGWNDEDIKNRTHLLYFHCLNITRDLTKYLLNKGGNFSAQDIYSIFYNWWEQNKDNKNAWTEHAVSERVLNVLFFIENFGNQVQDEQEIFESILNTHKLYLTKKENYKFNNHGLMMDRSVFMLSYYESDERVRRELLNLAKKRFKRFLESDFSSRGIHLENSPEYHRLTLNIINQIVKMSKYMNEDFLNEFHEKLDYVQKYLNILSMPNNEIPLLGDTSKQPLVKNKIFENIIDFQSGTFLFQNRTYWLYFRNNFQKETHRHDDLLSILYYAKGTPILIDSGKYNYDYNSEIREHIISREAHNTPYIKLDDEYKPNYDNRKTEILSVGDILHISGINYDNETMINRHIVYLTSSESLIILDLFIDNNKESKWYSNFVFNDLLNLIEKDENTFLIEGIDLTISSMNCVPNHIDKNNSSNNWISKRFNESLRTSRLIFENFDKKQPNVITFTNSKTNLKLTLEKEKLVINDGITAYSLDFKERGQS